LAVPAFGWVYFLGKPGSMNGLVCSMRSMVDGGGAVRTLARSGRTERISSMLRVSWLGRPEMSMRPALEPPPATLAESSRR
jgi:hypothetical protein